MRTHDDDRGASAAEYAILVSAVAAVIVVVLFALGSVVHTLYGDSCTSIGQGTSIGTTDCDK